MYLQSSSSLCSTCYPVNIVCMDCSSHVCLLLKGLCVAPAVCCAGGSTNAVLHLIAMSRSAGLNVTLDDFQRVSDRVRHTHMQAATSSSYRRQLGARVLL